MKAQGRARAVDQLSGRGRAGWTIMQAALLCHHIARSPTTAPSMASIQASSNAIQVSTLFQKKGTSQKLLQFCLTLPNLN